MTEKLLSCVLLGTLQRASPQRGTIEEAEGVVAVHIEGPVLCVSRGYIPLCQFFLPESPTARVSLRRLQDSWEKWDGVGVWAA